MTLTFPLAILALTAVGFSQSAEKKAPAFVEMFMPMRDTVVLAANVYLPSGPGPLPTILLRTPYIKDNPREPLTAQK